MGLKSLLMGLAAGAGLMYFNDPQMGDRRKALTRDQIERIRNQSDEAIDTAVRDLRNRSRGVLAEGMAMLNNERPNDWVLRERIRSKLGTLSRNIGRIDVDVIDGRSTLRGQVLQDEVEGLLAGLRHVRGIGEIDNQLQVIEGSDMPAELRGQFSTQPIGSRAWSPSTRLLGTTGGLLMWLYGGARGGISGTLVRYGGLVLAVRALTNRNLKALVGKGLGSEGGVVDVRKAIHINAPVEEVYRLWENYENFPRFMEHVKEIMDLGGGRSHWTVAGPAGIEVDFDAIETERIPNELITWETVGESEVKHTGRVRFNRQGDGTRVQVWMTYTPPAGALGHAVAELFGADPKSAMDKDLMRMKSMLEQGEMAGGEGMSRTDTMGSM